MSAYNLIKATSLAKRVDTIADLHTVTQWRKSKGMEFISPKGPSIRRLENAVALMLKDLDCSDCPKLVRGLSFYISILPEIKD